MAEHSEERVAASKRATNPRLNPAIAVELSMRERDALMDTDDWSLLVDLALAQEAGR